MMFLSYYFDIILKVNYTSSLFVKTSKKAKYNSCDDHNYGEKFVDICTQISYLFFQTNFMLVFVNILVKIRKMKKHYF